MAKTYKAVEVAAPGSLRTVERPIPEPGDEQVLIRFEACGICDTDSLTVEGQFPGLSFPRVPGHIEDTLTFSVLQNVRPIIETVPLERAGEAYARTMRGEARLRMVLTTGQ
jgi:D-arabinose 1-dehydrogenase-like Zn-dependent alcohol dehydrogenase